MMIWLAIMGGIFFLLVLAVSTGRHLDRIDSRLDRIEARLQDLETRRG